VGFSTNAVFSWWPAGINAIPFLLDVGFPSRFCGKFVSIISIFCIALVIAGGALLHSVSVRLT